MHPDNKWKMRFDLLIIILSIYNAIIVPYEAAYGEISSVALQVVDQLINAMFIIDIFINFRLVYRDSKTDEEIYNWK